MNNFNENNFSALLKLACAKLGVSEEQLKSALQSGNFENIKGVDAKKISEAVSNDEVKEKLLSSPAAQDIIKKFSQR